MAATMAGGTAVLAELPRNTAVRVLAAGADWYRVALPDGRVGYVTAAATESADRPVNVAVLDAPAATLALPAPDADVIEELGTGMSLDVLGRFGEYLLVQRPGGPAWLAPEPVGPASD
jgi:hypothetical protein